MLDKRSINLKLMEENGKVDMKNRRNIQLIVQRKFRQLKKVMKTFKSNELVLYLIFRVYILSICNNPLRCVASC